MALILQSRALATCAVVVLLYASVVLASTATASTPTSTHTQLRTAARQGNLAAQARALRRLVRAAIAQNVQLGAAFLRLAFHDAITFDPGTSVGGANGSIRFELGRAGNNRLQPAVNALTPMVEETGLGWGDAVAVAGATAVSAAGGPRIQLSLGRTSADAADPDGFLPDRSDNLAALRALFAPRGFSDTDLVALCGAHTLGRVGNQRFVRQSAVFQNDYFINLKWFVDQREAGQSEAEGPPITPNFQLESDMALISEPGTTAIVEQFAASEQAFFASFVIAYQKLTSSGF